MSSRSRNVIDLKKMAGQRASGRAPSRAPVSRPQRLRARRRSRRIVTSLACLLGGVALVGALGAASHLQQLSIAEVTVSGAREIPGESLVSAVRGRLAEGGFRLFSRENMFLYPKSAIESTLATEFPGIKEVSVARASLLATALVVTVEERQPYASWCASGASDAPCYVLDRRGFIFAEKSVAPETAYVFYGGLAPGEVIGQTFLEGRLHAAIGLFDALKAAGFTAVGLAVESEKDFTVTLASGQKIYASFDMKTADIIRNLTTTLEAEGVREKFDSLEYIDLRFGNRVYYK